MSKKKQGKCKGEKVLDRVENVKKENKKGNKRKKQEKKE